MAHGAGGKATQTLIEGLFVPAFGGATLEAMGDAGAIEDTGLAMTTDSFVVKPIRFPGGTIGELAVNGTVNDLAMSGARPLALSLSLILEEGLDVRRAALHRRRDRHRRPRGRRRDRRRRHQGRRARALRPDVRLHDRHREGRSARVAVPGRPASRRPDPRLRPDRQPRHGDHARARRVRARVDDRVGHALAVAGGRRADGGGRPVAARDARRDPRRRGVGAQRARPRLGRGDRSARGRRADRPAGRGRGRDPRDRPDVRRQRGQARRVRRARGGRRRAGRAARRQRAAKRRPRSER